MPTTYTADVQSEEWAEWLAGLDELEGLVIHLGKGRVRLTETAIAYLRCVGYPLRLYVHVTDDNHLFIDLLVTDLVRDQ
ncbi:hypothetical protein [Streptomyces sp. NPDC000994]